MKERFTTPASKVWEAMGKSRQELFLDNVRCAHCVTQVTMVRFSGHIEHGDLVLQGTCATCGGGVGRLIERE